MNSIRKALLEKHPEHELKSVLPKCNVLVFCLLEFACLIIKAVIYRLEVKCDRGPPTSHPAFRNGAVVLHANHYSHLDYLMIYSVMLAHTTSGLCPVAIASDHLNKGMLGSILRQCNVSFISRNRKNDYRILTDFYQLCAEANIPFILFPEGGWSANGNLKSFKYGILKIFHEINIDMHFVPIKIQTTRAIGDLNFGRIRESRTWNTKDSLWRVMKSLSSVLKPRGILYFAVGEPVVLERNESLDRNIYNLKKSIEQLGTISSFEQLIASIYRDLVAGANKAELIERFKNEEGFAKFQAIFDWAHSSEKDLLVILYHSFNQFIYSYICQYESAELRLIYEKFIFGNRRLDPKAFAGLDPFFQKIFVEMNEAYNL